MVFFPFYNSSSNSVWHTEWSHSQSTNSISHRFAKFHAFTTIYFHVKFTLWIDRLFWFAYCFLMEIGLWRQRLKADQQHLGYAKKNAHRSKTKPQNGPLKCRSPRKEEFISQTKWPTQITIFDCFNRSIPATDNFVGAVAAFFCLFDFWGHAATLSIPIK